MDLRRKLELMKKYDFRNFGNYIGIIEFDMSLLKWGQNSDEAESSLTSIEEAFQQMQQQYATIDFDIISSEMEEKDKDDFVTLYRTREILPRLQKASQNFAVFVRSNKYKVSNQDEAYIGLGDALTEMKGADSHQGCRYRSRIRNLENHLTKSEPAP